MQYTTLNAKEKARLKFSVLPMKIYSNPMLIVIVKSGSGEIKYAIKMPRERAREMNIQGAHANIIQASRDLHAAFLRLYTSPRTRASLAIPRAISASGRASA